MRISCVRANVDLKTKCTTEIEDLKIGREGRGTSAKCAGYAAFIKLLKSKNIFDNYLFLVSSCFNFSKCALNVCSPNLGATRSIDSTVIINSIGP